MSVESIKAGSSFIHRPHFYSPHLARYRDNIFLSIVQNQPIVSIGQVLSLSNKMFKKMINKFAAAGVALFSSMASQEVVVDRGDVTEMTGRESWDGESWDGEEVCVRVLKEQGSVESGDGSHNDVVDHISTVSHDEEDEWRPISVRDLDSVVKRLDFDNDSVASEHVSLTHVYEKLVPVGDDDLDAELDQLWEEIEVLRRGDIDDSDDSSCFKLGNVVTRVCRWKMWWRRRA